MGAEIFMGDEKCYGILSRTNTKVFFISFHLRMSRPRGFTVFLTKM